jgi:hypothetical protein
MATQGGAMCGTAASISLSFCLSPSYTPTHSHPNTHRRWQGMATQGGAMCGTAAAFILVNWVGLFRYTAP